MKRHFIAFALVSSLVGIACGDSSLEVDTIDDEEANLGTAALALSYGQWVMVTVDFGPCGVLPTTCRVGDIAHAHSGPGTAGGCYVYECQPDPCANCKLGTSCHCGDDVCISDKMICP